MLGRAGEDLDPIRLALALLTAFPAEKLADDAFVSRMRGIQTEWATHADPAQRRRASDYIAGYQNRLPALSDMRTPCLILGFDLDTDTFAARAREASDAIPTACYVEVADVGHLAPVTHPQEVWPVVVDFLERHAPTGPD